MKIIHAFFAIYSKMSRAIYGLYWRIAVMSQIMQT